ncbi:sodium/proline symporter [Thalassotalea maritima]|uniref:sodium/proline symporter n=1 Tax=Thalassotalea maritima TaxID=3242416 RepID=UPI0035284354
MSYSDTVLTTIIIYKLVLIGIGLWANKRTHNTEDYFIAGHQLGPWVAAISSAASASSAWTLLGMSGAAYVMGLSAIWIVPAVVCGYLFNWLWLAPRLQDQNQKHKAITLTEFIANNITGNTRHIIVVCSFCIVFAFTFYIAAQFQAAGTTFASTFDISMPEAVITGTAIILFYTLLGGFWAVSITDTMQGLLMALAALIVPVAALITVGGPSELWLQMQTAFSEQQLSFSGAHSGFIGLAFIAGLLAIGLGNPGQPHVVNRMMAIGDKKAVRQATIIAVTWAAIVITGMLIVGWCARVLIDPVSNNEEALLILTNQLFPPVIAGVIIAAILSAVMSTADSQLLVSSAAVCCDLTTDKKHKQKLNNARWTVVFMCLLSMLIALYAPEDIFSRVLFAWNALGAAFGPILIIILIGHKIDARYALASISCGFGFAVALSYLPSTPGDYIERTVPFLSALFIAWLGRRRYAKEKQRLIGTATDSRF